MVNYSIWHKETHFNNLTMQKIWMGRTQVEKINFILQNAEWFLSR